MASEVRYPYVHPGFEINVAAYEGALKHIAKKKRGSNKIEFIGPGLIEPRE